MSRFSVAQAEIDNAPHCWNQDISSELEARMTPPSNPTREAGLSPSDLVERAVHRRAVEAVIWSMPAVNAELMSQAVKDAKADFNQVVLQRQAKSKAV
jgi:hypothetical protein